MNQYGLKKRGLDKIKIKIENTATVTTLKKPDWLKVKCLDSEEVQALKDRLRHSRLHTVCEEAACPNIGECFSNGTATFMILGSICTRRCSFCDVAHGRPLTPDPEEPERLAETVHSMKLRYVVITSVDRDDLEDGGSGHFAKCIRAIRQSDPQTKIEVLVPDFKKMLDRALDVLSQELPDVLNHNIETVPRLYKMARPGSSYEHSLSLIKRFKQRHPNIPTKSGIMLGLGETNEEVIQTIQDLYDHDCDLLTIGQYLQPSPHHMPVNRYVSPEEFEKLKQTALNIGFKDVTAGPLVRSSYHADQQVKSMLSA